MQIFVSQMKESLIELQWESMVNRPSKFGGVEPDIPSLQGFGSLPFLVGVGCDSITLNISIVQRSNSKHH